jgi:hypothetical protein
MSAFSRPTASIGVSDCIRNPLREVARRRWIVSAGIGSLQTLTFALIALLLGALLLGYFEGMPRLLRVPVAFVTWAVVLWIAVRFLRPTLRPWSLSRAAMHVEKSQPGMHERLSSAVELADERDDRFRGSPALLAHLLRQAEKDAGAINAVALVRTDRLKRWGFCLAPVLMVWILFTLLRPLPVEAGLYRLFNPLSGGLPPGLSKIAVYPGDMTLAQGDDLKITAKLSKEIASESGGEAHAALVVKYPGGQIGSTAMEETHPREFEAKLTDLQQGFEYMVRTDSVDSARFHVVVNPRPAIISLDLRYDYPPYTQLPSNSVSASDGTIEAIAGTRVTLTIHANAPLVDKDEHKNQLLIDEDKPTRTTAPLAPLAGNDDQASLVVSRSGQYRIQLCNAFGLSNKDDQPRNIIAHFDQPPTITILSPTAAEGETARSDDIVPVRYLATDDFGVASIEVIVQVGENPPQEHVLPLPVGDHRQIKRTYLLDMSSILSDNTSESADRITYQFKATDNRDPDPQSAFSAKQTLIIDHNAQSFTQREDERSARELNRAIDQAIDKLNQAEAKSAALRNNDPNNPLVDQNRENAQAAEQHLADAAKDLHDQAEQQEATPFANVAKKANDIADEPIQKAEENAAKAELAADRPEKRLADAVAAQEQIAKARDQLNQLRNDIQPAREQAEAQRDLQRAAQLQAEAAKGFAEHPADKARNEHHEREAMQKLQEAMQHNAALRDDHAQQVAQRLADLANRIADLQNQQTRQQDQTAKQEQLAQTQDQANKLADQQKKLNDEIAQFAQQNKQPLNAAGAQPPDENSRNNIVATLVHNDLDNAANQMKQQADQLQQAGHQLRQQAQAHDPQLTPDEQATQQHDQQAAQAAEQEKEQANQAAHDLAQEAHQDQPPDANDAAEQQVAAAAAAIEQLADALHPTDPQAQQEAQAAHHDAAQAAQDAQAAEHAGDHADAKRNLNQASQELRRAARELARAAEDNTNADQANANEQQRQAADDAAEEAKQLAAEQKALAKAADQQRPAVARAHENAEPQAQAAQEQQQLADQARQAADQANALSQQAHQSDDKDVAHRAETAQHQLQQAATEQQQAAQAEQHGDAPHAVEHQDAAQQDLAQAQTDLRGLAQAEQANADQPHPDDGQSHSDANNDHPASDQGHPDSGQAEEGKGSQDAGQSESADADAGHAPMTPGEASQQAARRAQEAAAVQPQALQSNAQAAQEAANALQKAAEANAQAQPGQPHPGQPSDAQTTGQEPGKPGSPMSVPLPSLVSANGISAQQGTGGAQPESVKALGISAGDWARLPTLMRQELMNAAQQSAPPTYREMIKNYYVRIAREQAENGASGVEQQ